MRDVPLKVLGVVDLLRGRAVHARGGARDAYAPVAPAGAPDVAPGDAAALARAYLDLGLTEIYVADLDAILEHRPQDALVSRLVSLGASIWLDAGLTTVAAVRGVLDLGVARPVVGLETLASYAHLREICDAAGDGRVAFSLDLRHGEPILAGGTIAHAAPPALAARAADAGAGAVIVLDLARVGTGAGIDLDLVAQVRSAVPDVMLLAGGGIRDADDIRRLAEAGCDGVLLATALLEGRIGAAEIRAAGARS